jgi:hypothetical protein
LRLSGFRRLACGRAAARIARFFARHAAPASRLFPYPTLLECLKMKKLLSILFTGLFAFASTAALAADDKKAEPKKEEAQKTEAKKEEAKKPEAKKPEAKKAEAKPAAKKEEGKKEEGKKKEKKGGC